MSNATATKSARRRPSAAKFQRDALAAGREAMIGLLPPLAAKHVREMFTDRTDRELAEFLAALRA